MDRNKLVGLLRNLIEVRHQAEYDLCGEQREFHLPRLNESFVLACQLFPVETCEAMTQAEDAYGQKIAG